LSSVEGGVGLITLNRPRALNALTLEMIRTMTSLLKTWDREGSGVKVILVKGAGEKAFCSGGDVKSIAKAKGEPFQKDFIKEEYLLDHLVGSLKVPYITILDGITMGGGVGISINGRFRVGTEKTVFAMPECGIGLIPDVGAGYFLTKLEGKLGLFLGLTGHRVTKWECLRFGITTHAIKSNMVVQLEEEIRLLAKKEGKSEAKDVEKLLDKWSEPEAKSNNAGYIAENLNEINTLFTAETLEEILNNIDKKNTELSISTKTKLAKNSPTSMMLAFHQLKEGKPTLAEALIVEHRLMTRRFEDPDFYEGVRAALIDKDQNPVWKADSIKEISKDLVEGYFSKLEPEQDLVI